MDQPLPHEGVLTRLGVSRINGVGVFAIVFIPSGTLLFPADVAQLRWIDTERLDFAGMTAEQRALYADFAVGRDDRLGCPASFDLLTPGWYLNEPPPGEVANVSADVNCAMTASRDIMAGEELTVSYATFSER